MSDHLQSRLAILRHEIGITQRVLAQRAGLSLPYIKKLERGKKPMSKSPAVAMAVATGVDWKWLAGKGAVRPIMAKLGMTQSAIKAARIELPFRAGKLTGENPRYLTEKELRVKLAAGVPWKKEMADAIQRQKESPQGDEAEKMYQKLYRLRHHIFCVQLSEIIQAAMNQKRGELVVARIEDFIRELTAEPWLKIKPAKPPGR